MGKNLSLDGMSGENLFLIHAAILGIYFAFVYDCFRIFRRLIPHNVWFLSLEDIMYWIYLAAEVFILMYRESNGKLRWFAVLGAFCGIFLYTKLFGRYYVHFVSGMLEKIRKRLQRIYRMRLKSDHKLLKIRVNKR